jgi:hypothetical protein
MVLHRRLRHFHGWLAGPMASRGVRVSSASGRESGRGECGGRRPPGISRLMPSVEALLSLATLTLDCGQCPCDNRRHATMGIVLLPDEIMNE